MMVSPVRISWDTRVPGGLEGGRAGEEGWREGGRRERGNEGGMEEGGREGGRREDGEDGEDGGRVSIIVPISHVAWRLRCLSLVKCASK